MKLEWKCQLFARQRGFCMGREENWVPRQRTIRLGKIEMIHNLLTFWIRLLSLARQANCCVLWVEGVEIPTQLHNCARWRGMMVGGMAKTTNSELLPGMNDSRWIVHNTDEPKRVRENSIKSSQSEKSARNPHRRARETEKTSRSEETMRNDS